MSSTSSFTIVRIAKSPSPPSKRKQTMRSPMAGGQYFRLGNCDSFASSCGETENISNWRFSFWWVCFVPLQDAHVVPPVMLPMPWQRGHSRSCPHSRQSTVSSPSHLGHIVFPTEPSPRHVSQFALPNVSELSPGYATDALAHLEKSSVSTGGRREIFLSNVVSNSNGAFMRTHNFPSSA